MPHISCADLRKELMLQGLRREDLEDDPLLQFDHWYQLVMVSDLHEPSAMCLASVDAEGQPWQRMVLLKLYDEKGFVFFTNYSSRKANQIAANPKVSLLFPWHPLARQVKITGSAHKINTSESLTYFLTRPRGSQLGAWSSPQSQRIASRAILESLVKNMSDKFAQGDVPLPSFWGGYRVVVDSYEFWQARDNRLHDRFVYQLEAGQWTIHRLAP